MERPDEQILCETAQSDFVLSGMLRVFQFGDRARFSRPELTLSSPAQRRLSQKAQMPPTQPRHEDIIIRRRFGEHASTHTVKQIYAVTYPGHTDQGTERENYGDAEEAVLELAKGQGRSVWYEENPDSGRRTLVKSFRNAD